MIHPSQGIIRSSQLAAELGVGSTTIAKWGRTRLRSAKWARGMFLVQRLRDLGVLPRVDAADQAKAGAA